MRYIAHGVAALVCALGCGGLAVPSAGDQSVSPENTISPPTFPVLSTAKPSAVLIAKEALVGCELVLMKLPQLSETLIGDTVYCSFPEAIDASGERALIRGTVMSLKTGAVEILPQPPIFANLEYSEYHFDAEGHPTFHVGFGEGEAIKGEEGSVGYPIQHARVLRVNGGEWAEVAKTVVGEGVQEDEAANALYVEAAKTSETRLSEPELTVSGEGIESDPTRVAPLNAAAGLDNTHWRIDWGPPSVAYPLEQGEAGFTVASPILLQSGGAWVPLTGLPTVDLRVARSGDWLAVGGVSNAQGWRLVDLSTGKVVWKGGRPQFWPTDLPLPR